ncbi:transcription factor bHLH118-like [Momordica charantia]|uniref:Transcription factor bHLH118-like n=1 Tax=Momordica charantia TaxID=3673 RepID=A0A6J1CJV9_MOMCH|nr:transcription factor bHLH118-like [Momordica charantia]XP_022141228.1 transcription factor bHLH118-like [Momordica charantia]XP_022141229.1 transcription factor bHLH118-like [Momordica charantia]
MYPLQKAEEKCFQISFNPHQHIIPEDLIFGRHVSEDQQHNNNNNYGVNNNNLPNIRRRRKLHHQLTTHLDNLHASGGVSDLDHNAKIMHRERERQRRQEMGSLYMSLRTLLPLEFIKGKRAISDQMNGAVNYIKHQKKKIKEIEAKRDELKKLDDNNWNRFEKSRGQTPICSFKISSFGGGLEIVITTSGFNGFPLSRILKVVVEQGLDVISCSSSSVNEKSIHTVQMEVRDLTSLDLPQLEKKLTEAVPLLRPVIDQQC